MKNITRPALFLDRDGVINRDKNYVYKIKDFEINQDIFKLVRCAKQYKLKVIVVTNQSGIGRGLFTLEDFERLNKWMLDYFRGEDATIDRVFFCPSHPTKGIGQYKTEDYDRKPNPGMILKAKTELNLSLENSILIGDRGSDIQAASNAGIGTIIHLKADTEFDELVQVNKNLFVTNNMKCISNFIKKKYK